MILSYQSLMKRQHMFTPFSERTEAFGMTYGAGPAGYDIRVAETFTLDPGGFRCTDAVEEFALDTDILAYVKDKSTWARNGLSVFNTVLEPGWNGVLRLELVNHNHKPLFFKAGMPIAQVVCHQLDEPTRYPYAGRYQNQKAGTNALLLAADHDGAI